MRLVLFGGLEALETRFSYVAQASQNLLSHPVSLVLRVLCAAQFDMRLVLFCSFVFVFWIFETGFLCIALTVLELIL